MPWKPCVATRAAVFLCLVSALVVIPAIANGPRVGFQAGMVFPLASDSVQLVREQVVIHLADPQGLGDGKASCTYILRNLAGTTQVLSMAFSPYGYLSDSTDYRRLDFHVTANDQELPVRFFRTNEPRWRPYADFSGSTLPVWEIALAPRNELEVHMRYRVVWAGDDKWAFSYNARPASLWAGKIEDAEITFAFDGMTASGIRSEASAPKHIAFKASPSGYHWQGDQLVWRFRDWEPTEDVRVVLAPEQR